MNSVGRLTFKCLYKGRSMILLPKILDIGIYIPRENVRYQSNIENDLSWSSHCRDWMHIPVSMRLLDSSPNDEHLKSRADTFTCFACIPFLITQQFSLKSHNTNEDTPFL